MKNKDIDIEVLICGTMIKGIMYNSVRNLLRVHCEDKEFVEWLDKKIEEWENEDKALVSKKVDEEKKKPNEER